MCAYVSASRCVTEALLFGVRDDPLGQRDRYPDPGAIAVRNRLDAELTQYIMRATAESLAVHIMQARSFRAMAEWLRVVCRTRSHTESKVGEKWARLT